MMEIILFEKNIKIRYIDGMFKLYDSKKNKYKPIGHYENYVLNRCLKLSKNRVFIGD